MNKRINLMYIKLEGETSFVKNFNSVGNMYQKAKEMEASDIPKEEKDKYWDAFISAKYCLEQGIGQ